MLDLNLALLVADRARPGQPKGSEMSDHLLTIQQTAGVLGVSNLTVYRLIKRGRLRALRVGRDFRVRDTDLARYRESRLGSR